MPLRWWGERRSVEKLDAVPLAPAQVKQARADFERQVSRIVIAYIGLTIVAAFALAAHFASLDLDHAEPVVWGLVGLAGVYVVLLYAAIRGRYALAGVALFFIGVSTLVVLGAVFSAASQIHLFMIGLVFMGLLLVRPERAVLRATMALTAAIGYVSVEVFFPADSAHIQMSLEQWAFTAEMIRLGVGIHIAATFALANYRFMIARRILEGAALYGEVRATTDELTGVHNRRPVIEQLARWSEAGEGGYAIALIDIDRFKSINDDYGHECGDAIIQDVAATMTSHFREADMVSRWGGDEFLVLMRDVDPGRLHGVLDRLRVAVHAIERACGDHRHEVSVSIGAAMGSEGENPNECISAADHALYRAKQEGRNRVVTVGVPGAGRPRDAARRGPRRPAASAAGAHARAVGLDETV